jgi:mono/diheme cytochrome c family protein
MKFRPILFVSMILATTLLAAGYGWPEEGVHEAASPLVVLQLPEFRISKGEILYNRYCLFCHGESGAGDGLNAFRLPVKPASFSNQELMSRKSEKELAKVILNGGAPQGMSRYMPAFGHTFSDLEAQYLVEYIRHAF